MVISTFKFPADSPDKLKNKYDVVVIGGGLGGLTAANRLAKLGRSVLILEQHFNLGGLATWFTRGDHIFDVSLHGFPVGMKKTCRKYWNKDIADNIVQLKNIRFDNPQFSLQTSFDKQDFVRIITQKFNVPINTVEAFFDRVNKMDFYDDNTLTTRELFNEFFPGRDDVVRLLMEPITYANGSTLDDPAITYGIVFSNFMSKGVYTFQGGTDKFVHMMRDELIKNNVTIRMRSRVDKIKIENSRVKGVYFNGEYVKAGAVISNSSLVNTIKKLAGPEHFSNEFIDKTDKVRINNSSCQVYIGIKKGEKIENVGDLFFTSTKESFDTQALLSKQISSRTFSFYYPYTRPGYDRYAVVSSTNANYSDWADLSPEQYKKDKNILIEDTVEALSKYLPGIRNKIDYLEAATPCTFKRYTLHIGGSSFGTKFEGLDISMNICREVEGLFHTGSVAIIMSGWLGAANYGVIVSNNVERYLGV
jgi:phytoene dehydrogenase-like protein